MISAEEWDTRWWEAYNDAVADCHDSYESEQIADRKTTKQLGKRPAEEAS